MICIFWDVEDCDDFELDDEICEWEYVDLCWGYIGWEYVEEVVWEVFVLYVEEVGK